MEIGNVFFCECVSLLLLFSSSVVNSIVKSIVFTTDIFVLCKCLFSTYLLNLITIRIECEESVEILVTAIIDAERKNNFEISILQWEWDKNAIER